MKIIVVNGLAHIDNEKFPTLRLFNDAVNDAIKEFYIPVFGTFRVNVLDDNVMFTVLAELVEEPKFISNGGGDGGIYH